MGSLQRCAVPFEIASDVDQREKFGNFRHLDVDWTYIDPAHATVYFLANMRYQHQH